MVLVAGLPVAHYAHYAVGEGPSRRRRPLAAPSADPNLSGSVALAGPPLRQARPKLDAFAPRLPWTRLRVRYAVAPCDPDSSAERMSGGLESSQDHGEQTK